MIQENQVIINEAKIHWLEAGDRTQPDVLFLHGMKFSARTWSELGTLDFFASHGFHAVAVDLPGFGKSEDFPLEKDNILLILMDRLGLRQPVVVAPSFSGGYCLPVVAEHPSRLRGFVAVGSTNIPDYADRLNGNALPTLAIWGSNDEIVPVENADLLCTSMTNIRKVVLKDAGHPCYMTRTDDFHRELLTFFRSVS